MLTDQQGHREWTLPWEGNEGSSPKSEVGRNKALGWMQRPQRKEHVR